MSEAMQFEDREKFRQWLAGNCRSSAGVWLLFGKAGGPKTLKAGEALEEALCFGWIDGQMQSMGDKAYKKYFSLRRGNSRWSEKNKALAQSLEERGLMTELGREKMEEARKDGRWNAPPPAAVTGGADRPLGRTAGGIRARPHKFSGHARIRPQNLHAGVF